MGLESVFIIAIMLSASIIISSILIYTSNIRYRKISEADMVMRLSDRIYASENGKKILEMAKDPNKVIVNIEDKDGKEGDALPHRDVENFLNDVEHVFVLQQDKIFTDRTVRYAFSWVIDLIVENKSMMTFIAKKQEEYGDVAWKPISDYANNRKV
ncbi:MAG: hypothetical protein OXC46_07915 [Thaumarchaeota archaeon]|nr:hypothetical protein [Nitrososphaerota archaeon]